ncbi:MAG: UDP-2,3-diacylglucosamine diphosphatase [Pantoea sp. Brub]|nr:UDP-2,3-diacylglucosamine diphosphatase [Pantoea sp. Brub]
MKRILFVSDVHLSNNKPDTTFGFLKFLKKEVPYCDALYILGDLFDIWIGDDNCEPLHKQISNALNNVSVKIYFIHGNRDFLIRYGFANNSSIILLFEKHIFNIYDYRLLIMHGDILCTDDYSYQIFRTVMHQYWIQSILLKSPLFIRKYIANRLRNNSTKTTKYKLENIMDVNQNTVEKIMLNYNVNLLIHGHTHRPAIHKLLLNNKEKAVRAVLGAWDQFGSIIQLDNHGIKLIKFYF